VNEKWETIDIRAKMEGGIVSLKWTETAEHEQLIPVVDLEQLPHFATIIAERDELREKDEQSCHLLNGAYAKIDALNAEYSDMRAERDALRKRVQELEEANKPQGWTYSSLTNAYLGIPEGIGPSARTSMTQPLPPSEEISDG